jgi:hypothetical protein
MRSLKSRFVLMFGSIAEWNEGQPVPESYFVSDEKSEAPHDAQV